MEGSRRRARASTPPAGAGARGQRTCMPGSGARVSITMRGTPPLTAAGSAAAAGAAGAVVAAGAAGAAAAAPSVPVESPMKAATSISPSPVPVGAGGGCCVGGDKAIAAAAPPGDVTLGCTPACSSAFSNICMRGKALVIRIGATLGHWRGWARLSPAERGARGAPAWPPAAPQATCPA